MVLKACLLTYTLISNYAQEVLKSSADLGSFLKFYSRKRKKPVADRE